MKNFKYFYIVLITILFVGSCKQEPIVPTPAEVPVATTPSKGSADFTKFVAMGNSFVAGMQAQSLFTESQANSLPKIMAKQFESVGGSTTFNQPDINSVNGFNPISSNLSIGLVLGRLILFDADGPSGPRTAAPAAAKAPSRTVNCPSTVTTPATPAPYNTADFPTAYNGNKAALNNFGVPLIYLAQALTPATGGPAISANPAYSPFYGRFASFPSATGAPGSGSSMASDALTAAGSFYLLWIGFDDVLLYAATGADGASPGTYPMTAAATFTGQFNFLLSTFLGTPSIANAKAVVGNIPNFTSLPYFYTVPWNTIALDDLKASGLNSTLAANYNAFMDALPTSILSAEEKAKRKLVYKAGNNGVLMDDESLTNLAPYMVGPAAALAPYARTRQATSTDLVPLSAGAVLGTCANDNPSAIWGVSFPMPDRFMLTATETTAILARTAEFNAAISAAVALSSTRLALADVNKGYADFVTARVIVSDGVTITPSFAPPTGAFSEDGLHPNNRGNAFTANIFIDAINSKFGAVIPKAPLNGYTGTKLPVNP